MNNRDDRTSRIEATVQRMRREGSTAGGRMTGTIKSGVSKARSWSARHLPGGEVTMWFVLGLVLLVLFVWAILPGKNAGMLDGSRMTSEAQPVGVAVAATGDIAVTLKALGTVTPLATATVTPQVSGQVMRVDFREGQFVRAGDLLAVIDPRTYKAALDEAKGQLAKDRAALANAEIDLKRQRALFAAQATSHSDLDTAEATAKQDVAAVEADQATVASNAVKLGFTRVTSPISGRVGLRGVDPGNYVTAGQSTGIAVVTQMNPMSVLFAIPENSVGEVLARINAGAHIGVDVYDHTMIKKLAEGELVAVDSQISTTTGTVKMRAMFDNDDEVLFPNQFVNVKVTVDTLKNQVVVPVTAIQRGSQGSYVFVVKADHTVTMRIVTLGLQDGDRIAIAKGLNPGETVVTDGSDRLNEGATVAIPSGQKVKKVDAAESAGPVSAHTDRRALFRKLTPQETEKLQAMAPEDRKAWIKAHRDELMKRKDQPMPPGGFKGPGRGPGGPPPM
jgi:membrane fusion protein, multidrug efflux system